MYSTQEQLSCRYHLMLLCIEAHMSHRHHQEQALCAALILCAWDRCIRPHRSCEWPALVASMMLACEQPSPRRRWTQRQMLGLEAMLHRCRRLTSMGSRDCQRLCRQNFPCFREHCPSQSALFLRPCRLRQPHQWSATFSAPCHRHARLNAAYTRSLLTL